MARSVILSRDEAELLDTLLLDYFKRGGTDQRLRWLADDICEIWGMTPWDKREPQGGFDEPEKANA